VLDALARAQIVLSEQAHFREMPNGHAPNRCPELRDLVAREPVDDARPFAPGTNEPRMCEHLQVLRGVRDRLGDLARDLVDRALALGEQVDDLRPTAAAERLSHRRQSVEESRLRFAASHADQLIKRSLE
jgi:hypothetical protein